MTRLNITLVTGRSLRQGQSKEVGKTSKMYTENVAVCEIDPEDLEILKISSGTNVRVKTKTGEVVVKGLLSSQAPHRGIAFMPLGPWANAIISSESNGTGMPSYKGFVAEIRPAPEDVILEAEQLVEAIYRGK